MSSLNQQFRTALVTGVSSGLGRAVAEMLLAEGVRVWGTARRAGGIAPFERPGFAAVALDLADAAGARAAVRRAEAEAGGVFDLVILNAGHGLFAPFADGDWRGWEQQLQALVAGNTGVLHQLAPAMVAARRGCVVVVTGPAGEFQSGLAMAQAALSGLAAALEAELAAAGVRVLELRCGWLRTDFLRRMPVARLTTAGGEDARLAPAWGRLRRRVESAAGPARTVARLRRALSRSGGGRVVDAGPGRLRRCGRGLLRWLGVRPGEGAV